VGGFPNRLNLDSLCVDGKVKESAQLAKRSTSHTRGRTASECRELAAKTRDGGVVRRLLGMALLLEGQPRGEAAKVSGMGRQIVCDWVHRYNASGVAGLPPAYARAVRRR
jgi:Helix-turn-helix domain